MAQKFLVHTPNRDVVLEYEADNGDGIRVRVNEEGPWKTAGLEQVGNTDLFLLLIDNQPTELYLERRRGGASVTIGRHTFDFEVDRWRSAFENRDTTEAGATGTLQVKAPMTGSIVDVPRKVGRRGGDRRRPSRHRIDEDGQRAAGAGQRRCRRNPRPARRSRDGRTAAHRRRSLSTQIDRPNAAAVRSTLAVLGGELAVPCTRNPLQRG